MGGESAKLAKNVNSTVVGPRDKKGQRMADTVSSPHPTSETPTLVLLVVYLMI